MKNIKKIYKSAFMFGMLALGVTSCDDYLTIYPTDRVVEEDFWEDKNDLEGVRYGAYKQMASTVSKLAIWGDLRSDAFNLNTIETSEQKSRDTYNNIMKGMPDSSMTVFDWGGVYTTINYCNKVLQHGPEVLAKDKQFTSTEWQYIQAEMTALRALNYFYLIRAFKDIPYSTKVINTDQQVENFGLTNQLVVLDSIILDIESVEGKARNRFASLRDSKGMITNSAIYAILADMYLWRASLHEGRGITEDIVTDNNTAKKGRQINHTVKDDYLKCYEYCNKSLASLTKQNLDYLGSGYDVTTNKTINYGFENCDMIKNDFDGVTQSVTPQLEAMTSIFQDGNSTESIFELQFSQSDDRKNEIVNSLYGYSDGTHLMVAEEAIAEACGGSIDKWDSRLWLCCQNLINSTTSKSGYFNVKYMQYEGSDKPKVNFDGQGASREIKYVNTTSYPYYNWIVYRMTDVMLMRAEALACSKVATIDDIKDVKTFVKNTCHAIHRRSYCNYQEASKIAAEDFSSAANKNGNAPELTDLVKMVMNERMLELHGEGKRWFDLVRWAERNCNNANDPEDERESTEERKIGNGQSGLSLMMKTYMQKAYSQYYTTLINRLKNRWGMYNPIYEKEVKASYGKILQNPVWNKSKYEQ